MILLPQSPSLGLYFRHSMEDAMVITVKYLSNSNFYILKYISHDISFSLFQSTSLLFNFINVMKVYYQLEKAVDLLLHIYWTIFRMLDTAPRKPASYILDISRNKFYLQGFKVILGSLTSMICYCNKRRNIQLLKGTCGSCMND